MEEELRGTGGRGRWTIRIVVRVSDAVGDCCQDRKHAVVLASVDCRSTSEEEQRQDRNNHENVANHGERLEGSDTEDQGIGLRWLNGDETSSRHWGFQEFLVQRTFPARFDFSWQVRCGGWGTRSSGGLNFGRRPWIPEQ